MHDRGCGQVMHVCCPIFPLHQLFMHLTFVDWGKIWPRNAPWKSLSQALERVIKTQSPGIQSVKEMLFVISKKVYKVFLSCDSI